MSSEANEINLNKAIDEAISAKKSSFKNGQLKRVGIYGTLAIGGGVTFVQSHVGPMPDFSYLGELVRSPALIPSFLWDSIGRTQLSSVIHAYFTQEFGLRTFKSLRNLDKGDEYFEDKAREAQAAYGNLLFLPPIGGKIPLSDEGELRIRLDPSFSEEDQYRQLMEYRRLGKLGDMYVHQFTIQGKLPDEFKLAALALIFDSPYPNNWEAPFFEAPWGQIAPLIHDGGNVRTSINPLWYEVPGRTDFLQRVSRVHKPDLENLETFDVKNITQLSAEELEQARHEQEERRRFLLEGKAYRRLALALHSKVGTAPRFIDSELKGDLMGEWYLFSNDMVNLLREYDLMGAVRVPWFLPQPRYLDFGTKRYEANAEPVKRELMRVEAVRAAHPELKAVANSLLARSVERVDRLIGLVA